MSRVAVIGFAALSLGLSGCQKTQMKTVPKTSTPSYGVQPGGVIQPGIPVPMPAPRPTGWEGFDPQPPPPPLPPPPNVPGDNQPIPTAPQPVPTAPSSSPEPYVPPAPYPQSYPQPGPSPVAQYPQPVPVPVPTPIVRPQPQLQPQPLPQPQPTVSIQPQPQPQALPQPLPRPLSAPQAVRQIPTATQYAAATPIASPAPRGTPAGRALIGAPRPPSRPSDLMSTAVASTPPPATPASADQKGVTLREPIESVAGTCEPRPVKVTKTNKKLDILFVVDTSDSLVKNGKGSREDGELASIAREMPKFVARLPEKTEYRIGVMLAHGPTVPAKNWHGKKLKSNNGQSPYFGQLFSLGKNDPAVLDSRTMDAKEIARRLSYKMMNVPADYSDAQGEALILGLHELLTNKEKLAATMKQGLLRQKSAKSDEGRNVVIIMITDEQDVCYDYANGGKPTLKYYADTKTWERDREEIRFFNAHCRAKDGHVISYADVAAELRQFQTNLDGKVIVEAIAYKTEQPERAVKVDDEKEKGRGVIDLVDEMSGTSADMADVDRQGDKASFANELTKLGEGAGFQLKFSSSFDCVSKIHPNAIDRKQKPVELIISDNGRPIATYSTQCKDGQSCQHGDGELETFVDGKGKQAGLRVRPKSAENFARAMKAANVENATYEIKFNTLADCDTQTGVCEGAAKTVTKTPAKAKAKPAAKKSK